MPSPTSHLATDTVSMSPCLLCPLPWPVWCLVCIWQFTHYNKHNYTRKKQYLNKKYLLMYLFLSFLWVLCKLLFPSIFVFKLKFWILFTQRVRGCQFIPVSTNNLASNVDLISNSRSAVSRTYFLWWEQRRH